MPMFFFHLCLFHFLFLILPFFHFFVDGFVSRRAKCSIECFTKCANSGTHLAVYCDCPPLSFETDQCNSVNEQLLTDKTVERLIDADSGYKDTRTIWLKVAAVPGAFIYIFEFSTQQSFDRPIWTFAGASSSPQITFAVPDSCRDYQFRTIVILRSPNIGHQLTVFRPKSIPPQFPPFVVPKQSIQFDPPKQSIDQRTVHLSVSWQNPFGYDDVEVYGYSPPTAYPIGCQTAEDRLAPPRLELVQGGAKMHLALPAEVLRGQCRIYMEVRMLPRCVRIDPFDVQISIELNCQKFAHLSFCQKENGPKCANVVDLWGKDDGRVVVVWKRPASEGRPYAGESNAPLFYIVNWGITTQAVLPLTQTQNASASSIASQRIAHGVQLKVPGNRTNLELSGVRPATPYGVQICAFFSAVSLPPEASPFRTEPIIPFICAMYDTETAGEGTNLTNQHIDCSKIEQEQVPNEKIPAEIAGNGSTFWQGTPTRQMNVPWSPTFYTKVPSSSSPSSSSPRSNALPQLMPSLITLSSLIPQHSVHFISSDTAILDVIGTNALVNGTNAEENGGKGQTKRQNHSKTHKTEMSLALKKVEKQRNSSEAAEELTPKEVPKMVGKEKGRRRETEEKETKGGKTKMMKKGEEEEEEEEKGEKRKRGEEKGGEKETKEEEQWEEKKRKETKKTDTEKREKHKGKEEERWKDEQKTTRERTIDSERVTPMAMATGEKPKTKEGTTTTPTEGNTTIGSQTEDNKTINELNSNQQRMIRTRQENQIDESKAERKPGILAQSDRRGWLFVAPALFLFGLFVGLALLLLLVVRRRNARTRQNVFHNGNSLSISRKCMPKMCFPTGRSVLAARTMANGRFAAGNGIMPPVNCSSPAFSPQFSAISSVSTVESRFGSSGSVSLQRERETERTLPSVTVNRGTFLPSSATANPLADNTTRFFMRFPSANGGVGSVFFGGHKNNAYF